MAKNKILAVGNKVFIRTVTYFAVGKVESIEDGLIELSTASWVADTGRFSDAIKKGTLNEVEPVGRMGVSVGAIVDYFEWEHELPTEQK